MVFAPFEIEHFLSNGWTVLRDGFQRSVAERCCDFIWSRVGRSWDNCSTSGQPMIHLRQNFAEAPFDSVPNPRLNAAFDQLLGPGRWRFDSGFGWWPLLLPGFPGPGGWHIDGGEPHRCLGPAKGLVTLFFFSDAGPGDGGTPVIAKSHLRVTRLLHNAGAAGLSTAELDTLSGPIDPDDVTSLTGGAGDVAFLHPHLLHGFGPNNGVHIRFACNPLVELGVSLELERRDGDYSPVEAATRRAIET